MSFALILLGLVVVMVLLVRHHIRLDGPAKRGSAPHQNDRLIEGGSGGGGPGGGHTHVYPVTRDPKTYAKGFVPEKVRKNDER